MEKNYNYSPKLSEKQRLEILEKAKNQTSVPEIAKEYKLAPASIRSLLKKNNIFPVKINRFKDRSVSCIVCSTIFTPKYYSSKNRQYKVCSEECRKKHISASKIQYSKEQENLVINLKKIGKTNKEIVQIAKININTIKAICKKNQTFLTKEQKINNCKIHQYSDKDLSDYANLLKGKFLGPTFDNIKTKYNWECKLGHKWTATWNHIKHMHTWCPECNNFNSRGEEEVRNWLHSLNIKSIKKVYLQTKSEQEVDILIEDKAIGIEYNGLYWHSELFKNKEYHSAKRESLKEKDNITLIQINSNEWEYKQEIVKSLILSKLGLVSNRLYARKLQLKEVPQKEAEAFFNSNHLMGSSYAKNLGLYSKNGLECLISYKKHKSGIDISRFCTKLNTSVAGGLGKLLSEIEKREKPKYIQSFVDLRYGTGDSLLKLGFACKNIHTSFKWTNFKQTFNRLQCRANMDTRGLSEKEQAKELKWVKIYDAGQAKFIKEITNVLP